MKTKLSMIKNAMFALIAVSVLLASCKKDEPVNKTTDARKENPNEVIIDKDITSNRTFVKDSVYILYGNIFVTEGATLIIKPGTVIKGEKTTKGTLIIKQGAKIMAQGASSQPIVFTSRLKPGMRAAGDWGGLILVGKAPINQSSASVEGLTQKVEYGTSVLAADKRDAHDNSGVLQYVRIEFGGIALQPDNEINGLTLCSVGDGTTIDHVQVSYAGDDSFEWFGGNVNAKYLIAFCGLDDDFDTDFGYSGKVQFALAVRNPRIADVSTSNGFESDNDGTGTASTPKTSAVFSNITLIGPWRTSADKNVNAMFGAGMHIRRNSSLSAFNSVFAGWNTGLLLDGATTLTNATNGDLAIQNCALVASKVADVKGAGGVTDAIALGFFQLNAGNKIIATNADAGISNSFYDATKTGIAANPTSFLPASGSPLLSGASYTHAKLQDSFFDKTPSYIGAFGATDWTKESWVNFDPQNTVY